jgi:hypothetical protein
VTTVSESILAAAGDLAAAGRPIFSGPDLVVAAWRRDPERFCLPGYPEHPHSNRVLCELSGDKASNPVARGFLARLERGCYRLTDLGRAEIRRVADLPRAAAEHALAAEVLGHPAFEAWRSSQVPPLLDPFAGRAAILRQRLLPLAGRVIVGPRGGLRAYGPQDISDALAFLEVVARGKGRRGVA